jgi:hypothetical protein
MKYAFAIAVLAAATLAAQARPARRKVGPRRHRRRRPSRWRWPITPGSNRSSTARR